MTDVMNFFDVSFYEPFKWLVSFKVTIIINWCLWRPIPLMDIWPQIFIFDSVF